MEQLIYQRPREKLRIKGTAALGTSELIQLIISSGTSNASAGRVARDVEQLLKGNNLTYEALRAVYVIGDAKACQLLAAVELSRRL